MRCRVVDGLLGAGLAPLAAAVIGAVLLVEVATGREARAESELSRDTKSRHGRAAARARRSASDDGDDGSSSRSRWSGPRTSRDDRRERATEHRVEHRGVASNAAPATYSMAYDRNLALRQRMLSRPAGGQEILVGGLVAFDRLQGTAGGRVVHQDGLGWGFFADGATYRQLPGKQTFFGLGFNTSFTYSHLLEGYRPDGADFTSDLRYLTFELDVGLRYLHRFPRLGLELGWGVGVGGQVMHAFETFSDGLSLDEILASGVRVRPHVSLATIRPTWSGRPFIDVGLTTMFGSVSEHIEDYDSLVAGLEPVMVTPYLRVGNLIPIGGDRMLGINYELEMIGGRLISSSMSHKIVVLFRHAVFWGDQSTPGSASGEADDGSLSRSGKSTP